MKISTILQQIDDGGIALPEFQRGYVWNRDQVRGLMDSLYRKHPVGSLLVWTTRTENVDARGEGPLQAGVVKLLLDGQQRITTLYGLIRGRPPRFFDGNAEAFSGLRFHLDDEMFQFYGPVKMAGDSRWIDVTELMQKGMGEIAARIFADPGLQPRFNVYLHRLTALTDILERDMHIEEVAGERMTVDVVVEIFNKVNSGGTKLSKGDLALAKICAEWPQARSEMQGLLDRFRSVGFHFKLDWLLRNINTILTGEAMFAALKDVNASRFRHGLVEAEQNISTLLDVTSARLGLDHDRVLGSRYSFPLMVRYLSQRSGRLADHREWDRLLYWYVNTILWGRYAGSTETVLNQDLAVIEANEGALDRLIELLRQDRGDLSVHPADFTGWSKSARFYPLLYMLTRVYHARDWESGVELRNLLLGRLSGLQLHHIFPKARLYEHGYTRPEVNALANFTFLTQRTNLLVSDADPAEYLPAYAAKSPGVLESHWIPTDSDLWRVERYPDFLEARRELLAAAANRFLGELLGGAIPQTTVPDVGGSILYRRQDLPDTVGSGDEEMDLLAGVNDWVTRQGLPEGEIMYEVLGPFGEPVAVLDLAWPDGLQQGYSQPVALLVDEPRETEEVANTAGFRYFTSVESFQDHVQREVLAMANDAGG